MRCTRKNWLKIIFFNGKRSSKGELEPTGAARLENSSSPAAAARTDPPHRQGRCHLPERHCKLGGINTCSKRSAPTCKAERGLRLRSALRRMAPMAIGAGRAAQPAAWHRARRCPRASRAAHARHVRGHRPPQTALGIASSNGGVAKELQLRPSWIVACSVLRLSFRHLLL